MTRQRPGRLSRLREWIGQRRRERAARQALVAFEHLDDHLRRDVGLTVSRSAGPRRYDPWI